VYTLPLRGLPSGTYQLCLSEDQKLIWVGQLVKVD